MKIVCDCGKEFELMPLEEVEDSEESSDEEETE